MRWLDSITNSIDMNLSKLQEKVESRGAWRAAVCGLQRAGHNLTTEQQKQYMVTKTEWTLGDFLSLFKNSLGFPSGSVGKECACNAGGLGSIPGSGRSPGKGNGNSLQYSCLGNPMDREAGKATVWDRKESDRTVWLTFTFTNSLQRRLLVPVLGGLSPLFYLLVAFDSFWWKQAQGSGPQWWEIIVRFKNQEFSHIIDSSPLMALSSSDWWMPGSIYIFLVGK